MPSRDPPPTDTEPAHQSKAPIATPIAVMPSAEEGEPMGAASSRPKSRTPKRLKELTWSEKGELSHKPIARASEVQWRRAASGEGRQLALLCVLVFALTLGALRMM